MLMFALKRTWYFARAQRHLRLPAGLRVLGNLYLVEYAARLGWLGVQLRWGAPPAGLDRERLTVIVPAYDRFENLRPIARTALALPFLERLIVVNGHPSRRLGGWLPDDPRVTSIEEPGSGVGVRFSVAERYPAPYYLTCDDDIILRPDQYARLFRELLREPGAVHGVIGARYTGRPERPFQFGIHGRETRVDVLNGVFAFTAEHLAQYHRRLALAGLPPSRELHNGEDIVLSACGDGQPRVHAVGRWIQCPSSIDERVAVHLRRAGFGAERLELFHRLRPPAGVA
jgi:hypothetical protein